MTYTPPATREVTFVGGPRDGATEELELPLPLGLTVTVARQPIYQTQLVTTDMIDPGGAMYRLDDDVAPPRYVFDGVAP